MAYFRVPVSLFFVFCLNLLLISKLRSYPTSRVSLFGNVFKKNLSPLSLASCFSRRRRCKIEQLTPLLCLPKRHQGGYKDSLAGNGESLAAIWKECRVTRNYKPALNLVERIIAAATTPSLNQNIDTILTPAVCTTVIQTYGETGNLGKALGFMKTMQQYNIEMNQRHYGALIQACRRAGQWEMAVEIFERMREPPSNVKHNTVLYNSILATLGEARQLPLALKYFDQMKTEGIPKDTITYGTAISACEKAGNWPRALELYEEMERIDNLKPNSITLNSALSACMVGKQWEKAIRLFDDAGKRGIERDAVAYSVVIATCGESRKFELAKKYFESMDSLIDPSKATKRDTGTYNAMMTACERSGKWQEAIALLTLLKNSAPDSKTGECLKPDCRTYSIVINCCGNAGRWEQALDFFNEMDQYGLQKDAAVYNTIINALQAAGTYGQAYGVYNDIHMGHINSSVAADIFNQAQKLYSEGVAQGKLQHWISEREEKKTMEDQWALMPFAQAYGKKKNRETDEFVERINNDKGQEDSPKDQLRGRLKQTFRDEIEAIGKTFERNGWIQNSFRTKSKKRNANDDDLHDANGFFESMGNNGNSNGNHNNNYKSDKYNKAHNENMHLNAYKKMDLHGFPSPVAKAAVDYVFREIKEEALNATRWLNGNRRRGKGNAGEGSGGGMGAGGGAGAGVGGGSDNSAFYFHDLYIVTGRGNHLNSKGTRGVLRQEVEAHILSAMEPAGILSVTEAPGNDGMLIVSKASIRKWMERIRTLQKAEKKKEKEKQKEKEREEKAQAMMLKKGNEINEKMAKTKKERMQKKKKDHSHDLPSSEGTEPHQLTDVKGDLIDSTNVPKKKTQRRRRKKSRNNKDGGNDVKNGLNVDANVHVSATSNAPSFPAKKINKSERNKQKLSPAALPTIVNDNIP